MHFLNDQTGLYIGDRHPYFMQTFTVIIPRRAFLFDGKKGRTLYNGEYYHILC